MDILVYLEAMRKFLIIFFYAKKMNSPQSYTFSQNLTKFGKSGFFERKKHFVKNFSHSFQIHQNVHAVIIFILTYSYWKSVDSFKSFLYGNYPLNEVNFSMGHPVVAVFVKKNYIPNLPCPDQPPCLLLIFPFIYLRWWSQ